MAEKTSIQQTHTPKSELIRQLAASRDCLTADIGRLATELDLRQKFACSFRRHTRQWLSAAAIAGVALVILPARRKGKKPRPSGHHTAEAAAVAAMPRGGKKPVLVHLAIELIKLILPALKPVVIALATRQAASIAGRISPK